MHGPVVKGATITVRIGEEELRAKNFDNPSVDRRFAPGSGYTATIATSSYNMRWLVVEEDGKRHGWPAIAVKRLIELGRLIVYVDDNEVDSIDTV